MTLKIGIYKITSPSNRVYIGQSVNIKRRERRYSLSTCKKQTRLYNSIKKYGWKNHVFEVIEECKVEELNKRERFWQDHYDVLGPNGLNCLMTTTESKSGYMSKESREKLSNSNKGKVFSKKHKNNISKA